MPPTPLPVPATTAAVLLVCLVPVVLLGVWWYLKITRPARLLRDALEALVEEIPGAGRPAEPLTRRLARAAGPLAACAGPLELLADRLREMDRQLHDEAVNLQAILGGLSEGVLIVDRAHKIRLANDGLRRMFDLPASPLNRTLLEVFRHHTVQQAILEALDGGPSRTRSLTLATRQEDGRYLEKHFDLTAAGLRPRGAERPGGAIAVFHDVSRLKALEGVRRDFVANVSHELRTPLSIIHGYLETLLEEDAALLRTDPATARRFLQTMSKHGERLNLLVEDLLTISQLENGSNHAEANGQDGGDGRRFEPVDLRTCLERVVERLAPVLAERRATVRLEVPAGLRLEADPHRLDQAFFNLLDNALKYGVPLAAPADAAADPAEIRVHAAREPLNAARVTIAISDDGPGIPLADQPHVFERFYRVHKDRSREAGGTGLGLAIVKHVAQAHGGQVSVQSQPGRGATFRLELPVAQPAADA